MSKTETQKSINQNKQMNELILYLTQRDQEINEHFYNVELRITRLAKETFNLKTQIERQNKKQTKSKQSSKGGKKQKTNKKKRLSKRKKTHKK